MFKNAKLLEHIKQLEKTLNESEQERMHLANENLMLKQELQKKKESRYFA